MMVESHIALGSGGMSGGGQVSKRDLTIRKLRRLAPKNIVNDARKRNNPKAPASGL